MTSTTHNPTNSISEDRIKRLLLHHIENEKQVWLITAAILAGLTIIIPLVGMILLRINLPELAESGLTNNFRPDWTTGYLLIGVIFTSRLFRHLHRPETAWQPLMLPASTLEKWLAAWLISVPVYTIGFVVLSFVVSLVLSGLSGLITGTLLPVGIYLSSVFWLTFAVYVFGASIYLWGGIRFKSLQFLKTTVWLAGIYFALFLLSLLGAYLLFTFGNDQLPDVLVLSQRISEFFVSRGIEDSIRIVQRAATLLLLFISAPILWRSYVQLAKKEVV
jgi:hypothetical protein